MTLVTSRPRAIVIGQAPEAPLRGFVSTMQVTSRGGGAFRVELAPDDANPPVHADFRESVRTLSDLIEAGWRVDWKRELARRAPEFEAAHLPTGTLVEASAAQIDSVATLSAADRPEQSLLMSVARIVRQPPTVFCLAKLDGDARRLLEALAIELKNMTADDLVKNRFCFAQLQDDQSSKLALGEFIDLVVGSWTGLNLEEFKRRHGPVLLIGPTGTGKTEFAKRLHGSFCSDERKFVKLNVGALTQDLLEARLRGYKKGAFTGAHADTPGAFEKANGGTLFLDEFQSASPETQLQLLDLVRAVSNDVSVARVGDDDHPRHCRVKVVLAANEPLDELLAEGALRQDLYHRVRVVHELPTLKARLSGGEEGDTLLKRLVAIYRWKSNPPLIGDEPIADLALLFPRYDEDVLHVLRNHDWPGNLRELERVCFDMNWRREQEIGDADVEFLQTLLHRHSATEELCGGGLRTESSKSPNLARIRRTEEILFAHALDPAAARDALGEVRLRTPHHLRTFLRKHQHLLSSRFVDDPRGQRLLARRRRPATAGTR